MNTVLIVLIIAVVVVALMMAGLGTKMLAGKEKEFRRPCANADPTTGRCAHCTCGRFPATDNTHDTTVTSNVQ